MVVPDCAPTDAVSQNAKVARTTAVSTAAAMVAPAMVQRGFDIKSSQVPRNANKKKKARKLDAPGPWRCTRLAVAFDETLGHDGQARRVPTGSGECPDRQQQIHAQVVIATITS